MEKLHVMLSPEAIAKRNEYDIAIEPALVDEEPSTHRPHRRIFGDAFMQKRVNELEPRIREIVNRYIDRFIDKGRADMVEDLMYEVPALAVFIFLGAEDDDAVLVKQLAGPRAVVNFGLPNISEQLVEKQALEYLPTLVFRGPKALWVEWDVSQNPS